MSKKKQEIYERILHTKYTYMHMYCMYLFLYLSNHNISLLSIIINKTPSDLRIILNVTNIIFLNQILNYLSQSNYDLSQIVQLHTYLRIKLYILYTKTKTNILLGSATNVTLSKFSKFLHFKFFADG